MTSDLRTNLPKCQENLNLKPSLYPFCYMYNSFRHKLNSFRQRFYHLLTSHVTSGHLRSQHCSHQGILCLMTSFMYSAIVSQIVTDSPSALVKETLLLENPSNGKCNNLPLQDHFDHFHALRSRSVNPTKGSGRGAFSKHNRGGFYLKMFFCKPLNFLSTDLWHSAINPTFDHFVRQLRPELIRYLPAFCNII